MNLILFDTDARNRLLPLTATRPMAELRVGALTLSEKWQHYMPATISYITQEYLEPKFPVHVSTDNLLVNGGLLPTRMLAERITNMRIGEALLYQGELLAARLDDLQVGRLLESEQVDGLQGVDLEEQLLPLRQIGRLWDFIQLNDQALRDDFELLRNGKSSAALSESNRLVGRMEDLFLEEGVKMECCTLNTKTGPIYIGKNVEVMEGSMLRGPLYIGPDTIVKLGAKIYGPTTIGPGCRVGGEVTRSIMLANSNKGHDGFLGDSVLGEWCNLGADTNNSNLKNNYSEVKLWDYATERFERSGTQFLGLIMGDHAKCGINTMFNTGTVVGVFANVFGAGYPRNFIPDFSWGGADAGYKTYVFASACETASQVLGRRHRELTEEDKAILFHIYDRTARFRTWEK